MSWIEVEQKSGIQELDHQLRQVTGFVKRNRDAREPRDGASRGGGSGGDAPASNKAR